MKIALLGATGNVGTRLLDELIQRGHKVTALARHIAPLQERDGIEAIAVDSADSQRLSQLLKGHEVVISSMRFINTDAPALIQAVKEAGVKRFCVVGGAGSLLLSNGTRLVDSPEFPEAYKAEALAGCQFLEALQREKELDWVFLSPSADFQPGERTGVYRLGKDTLLSHAKGSSLSFEDFAHAMVNEVEQPQHHHMRFTIGY